MKITDWVDNVVGLEQWPDEAWFQMDSIGGMEHRWEVGATAGRTAVDVFDRQVMPSPPCKFEAFWDSLPHDASITGIRYFCDGEPIKDSPLLDLGIPSPVHVKTGDTLKFTVDFKLL